MFLNFRLLLILFVFVKSEENEILKATTIFPTKSTILVGKTSFKGVKVWDEKSLHNESTLDSEDGIGGTSIKEMLDELQMEDVLISNGERYRSYVNSNDILELQEISKERRNENVEITSCVKENCNGDITNEGIRIETTPKPLESRRRLSILGSDDRWEISGNPISWSPAKHTGLLSYSGGYCSAVLIGSKYILTAGHCVHEGNGGDYYSNFIFYPGRNALDSSIGYTITRIRTFRGWVEYGDWNHDLAVLELNVSPNIGYVAFGSNSNLATTDYIYHKGYSNDKPFGSQWSTYDQIWMMTYYQLRTDDSDVTNGGNDGGPWYRYSPYGTNQPVVYGIQSGSGTYIVDDINEFEIPYNRHTRITTGKVYSICDFTQCSGCCEIGGCIC